MSEGIFITGTDTGVGKTIVSALIIRALIKKGIKVGAMKPVETGCTKKNVKSGALSAERTTHDTRRSSPSDGMFLKEMAEMDDLLDLIAPVRFEHPLAPMVAADLELGVRSSGFGVQGLKKILDAYETLSKKYDFMVVEGVGGLLVPVMRQALSDERAEKKMTRGARHSAFYGSGVYFVVDLIKDLKLPVVVVAKPTLGTINHTLLTVNHALREGINVLGVIINCNTPSTGDLAEKTNPDVLKELCPVPVIGTMPYIKGITLNSIDDAVGCLNINF